MALLCALSFNFSLSLSTGGSLDHIMYLKFKFSLSLSTGGSWDHIMSFKFKFLLSLSTGGSWDNGNAKLSAPLPCVSLL